MGRDTVHSEDKLANFTKWLRIVIALTIIALVVEVLFMFQSDIPLALKINGEFWSRGLASFNSVDHLLLTVAINLSKLLWLVILLVFWQLCNLYTKRQVFTVENARCFQKVGWIFLLMCLWELAIIPTVGGYLLMRGVINDMPDWDVVILNNLDYLVPGLIFILLAKIMEYASIMREESDLTI